jgi:glutathione S-transferase
MLTFFHSPGSCSNGIFLLLEELGVPYQIEIIDVKSGQQFDPAYLAKNPKGKVPAILREDGEVMTEFPAIAYWLANQYGGPDFWPSDLDQQRRTLEALDYIVATIHMRGFTLIKATKKFQLNEQGTLDLRAYGRVEAEKTLSTMADRLGDRPYLAGDFGIADAALFYVLRWAEQEDIPVAENLQGFLARLYQRETVQKVIALEA